jgi:hypothetical protein
MNASHVVGVVDAEGRRHARTPVAALCDVTRVTETRHQLVPGGRYVLDAPARLGWLAAEPEAR